MRTTNCFWGVIASSSFALSCIAMPSFAATATAVEYYHKDFNHYFITAFPDEAAMLDAGNVVKGWTRTGKTFKVENAAVTDSSPVCRFFSTNFAPKSSHFYTGNATECDTVKANANWQYEAIAFYASVPDSAGNCQAPTVPIYRLYNDGKSGAPNHRYTTDGATRSAMMSQGWIPEGNGAGVVFCASPATASFALCEVSSFFGSSCSSRSVPHVSSGVMQATVLGSTSITIATYRLTVSDAPATVTHLVAADLNNVTTAYISGLSMGQQIQPGQTVTFSLVSGLTRGREANLRFVLQASGAPIVDVTYQVRTN